MILKKGYNRLISTLLLFTILTGIISFSTITKVSAESLVLSNESSQIEDIHNTILTNLNSEISFTSYSVANGLANITWEPVPEAVAYLILINGMSAGHVGTEATYNLIIDSGHSELEFTVQPLINGHYGTGSSISLNVFDPKFNAPQYQWSYTGLTDVYLQWAFDPNLMSYEVKVNGDVVESYGTAVSLSQLNPGTAYEFSVVGIGYDGYRTAPLIYTLTTETLASPNLIFSQVNQYDAYVEWSYDPRIWYYDVTINGQTEQQYGTLKFVYDLTPGTAYEFSVVGVTGEGLRSAPLEFTLTTLPAEVDTTIHFTSHSVADGMANIAWEPVPGAVAYLVLINGVSAGHVGTEAMYSLILDSGHSVLEFTVQPLINGQYGTGGSITLDVSPTLPEDTTIQFTSHSVADGRANIAWEPVPGAVAYLVLINGVSAGHVGTEAMYSLILDSGHSVLEFTVQPLINGQYGTGGSITIDVFDSN